MRSLHVFGLVLALMLTPQLAKAQAFWIDYSWQVAPKDEKRFMIAFEKFRASPAFSQFKGKIWFNVNVSDGADPATHSFATVYDSLEEFEQLSAALAQSDDWNKFRRALDAAGNLVTTATYLHVRGYGDHPKDKSAFMGSVAQVTNPAGYIGSLDRMMASNYMADLPGALDVWQILSGGPPGATHLVVFGYDRFSEGVNYTNKMASNSQFRASMANLGQYRNLLGTVWVNTVGKFGPSDLAGMR